MEGDAPLYLVVREGQSTGTAITIPPGVCVVGSSHDAQVRLDAAGLRPHHLSVELDSLGVAWATPLDAAEVSVNGSPIARRTMLEPGDRVSAGAVSLELAAGQWSEGGRDTRVPPPPPSAPTVPPPSMTGAGPALTIGQLVSERYRVIARLAAGGMGEVFRVQHVELGRTFAMKVMKPELSSSPDFVDRFRREAVASSRIGHPNIVDITDFGRTAEGAFYFVMEHLEGQTLGAAHAQGIVHRDLKPDNVMLVQRPGAPDTVKVLDFGIAKVDAGLARGGQTGVGVVVGTPQYMSPEQAAGRPVDHRSDLYSLALIFYELLAGRPAFNADTPPLLMMQQISEPAPPLPSVLEGRVPMGLEQAVFSMLAKRPEARPVDAAAVLSSLNDVRLPAPTGVLTAPPLAPMFGAPTEPMPRPATPTRVDTPRGKARAEPSLSTKHAIEAIRASRKQRNLALFAATVAVVVLVVVGVSWSHHPPPPLPAERGEGRGEGPAQPPEKALAVEVAPPPPPPEPVAAPTPTPTRVEKPPRPKSTRKAPREDLKDPYADDLKELE